MKISKNSFVAAGLLLIGSVGISSVYFFQSSLTFTVHRRADLDRRSHAAAEQLLSEGSLGQAHSAVLYIPKTELAQAAAVVVGTEIRLPNNIPGVPPGTSMVIDRIAIDTFPGSALARIGIDVRSPKEGLSFALDAEGVVEFSGEDSSRPVSLARFGIDLTQIRARADWNLFHVETREFAAHLLGSLLTRQLASQLEVNIPLPPMLSGNFQLTRAFTAKVPDTGGSVSLSVTSQDVPITLPLGLSGALFTSRGLYIVADEPGTNDRTGAAPISQSDMAAFFAGSEFQAPANPVASDLWLNGDFMADCAAQIGKLSLAQRTAHVTVTGHAGDLYRTTFQLFGEGGLWLSLGDKGAADIHLDGLQSQWKPGSGIEVHVPVSVSVTSAIALRGKALGVSKTVPIGIVGGGGAALDGVVEPVIMEAAGYHCLAFKLEGNPLPVSLSASTDGNFIADFVHLKVAKVGGTLHAQANPAAIPAVAFLTNAPFVLPMPEFRVPAGCVASSPHSALKLAAAPVSVTCDARGIDLSLAINIEPSGREHAPIITQSDALKEAQGWASAQVAGSEIVTNTSLEFDIAGSVFGPNNDIYRFFKDPVGRSITFVRDIPNGGERLIAVVVPGVVNNAKKAGGWIKKHLL